VFFLQIGIDARIESFARAAVLRDAAILLAVAIVGKLLAPIGAIGSPGDKLLIGLGMLPRGEVGLIFATIGLQQGVLGDDLYASLLLVVLATTLITPQLLKMRYTRLRTEARSRAPTASVPTPLGGWLRIEDGQVRLAGTPQAHLALPISLEAAADVATARPSPELLDWLSRVADEPMQWDKHATDALLRVVEIGNARSWRFLENIGVLDRVLPELAEALRSRQSDPFLLDPMSTHRWSTIERLRAIDEHHPLHAELEKLDRPSWLYLGALLAEGLEGIPNAVQSARRIIHRLDLGAAAEQEIATLVADQSLLWSAARRPDGLTEESVLQLASHLDKPEHARALYLLSVARGEDRDDWEHERLGELHDLIQAALANSTLTGLEARNLVGRRQAEAVRLAGDGPRVVARIEQAPRAYVLREDSPTISRHAQLLEPLPMSSEARVHTLETERGWWIDVAARDRSGLLACVTGVLVEFALDVHEAIVATWPDGAALESFCVSTDQVPEPGQLREAIEAAFDSPRASAPLPEALVTFDDEASPWHTVCEVRSPDKPGLLHALANSFAASGVEVHLARIAADDGTTLDRFDLTDRHGHKLDQATKFAVERHVAGGVTTKRRRFRRTTFSVSLS
jgi:UTP:GlnB (protein PII) uridylyltransferase